MSHPVIRSLVPASLVIFAVLAGAQSGGPASGEVNRMNSSPRAVAGPTDVQSLATAHALIRHGDHHQDPHALITAARIIQQIGTSPTRAVLAEGVRGPAKEAANGRTVDALLQRAKTMSGQRADIVAAADDVARSSQRGRVGGPGRVESVVPAEGTHTYRIAFRGGESALVLVSGDGDSDLDLFVYDENGRLVCSDEDETDDMVCGWTPRRDATFRVVIKNLGIPNEYFMLTN